MKNKLKELSYTIDHRPWSPIHEWLDAINEFDNILIKYIMKETNVNLVTAKEISSYLTEISNIEDWGYQDILDKLDDVIKLVKVVKSDNGELK